MPHDPTIYQSDALGWVMRVRAPAFDEWEAFETWLAADPAHPAAYHALATAEQDLDQIVTPAPPQPIMPPRESRARGTGRRFLLGGAMAAVLAIVAGYAVTIRPDPYRIATGPGMRQTVVLPGGTSITLNGDTAILLDRKRPRSAALEHGEALFAVMHDAHRPFTLTVGKDELLDVGTRFNVVRGNGTTEVQIAEGAVVYNPDREALHLAVGETLHAADADPNLIRGKVEPRDVGAWRDGRLVFDGETLDEVAAQLTRYTGSPVRVAREVADLRFRGVLNLDRRGDVAALGLILGVQVRRDGGGWVLVAP